MVKWPTSRRERRISLAIALVLAGALLLVLSVPGMTSRVVGHERVVFGDDPVRIGPYNLEGGNYEIWIEDYFPGFDHGGNFEAEASSGDGAFDVGWSQGQYTTRTIQGVDCEHAVGFDNIPGGDWTFHFYGESTEGDAIHVFIVEEYDFGPVIMFGVGVVCITLGLIMTGLLLRGRERGR